MTKRIFYKVIIMGLSAAVLAACGFTTSSNSKIDNSTSEAKSSGAISSATSSSQEVSSESSASSSSSSESSSSSSSSSESSSSSSSSSESSSSSSESSSSSSESSSSSSESSSSSSSSSAPSINMVAKTATASLLVTSGDALSDGFFTLVGGSIDGAKNQIKLGGSTTFLEAVPTHVLKFSIPGAGDLSLTFKSGSAGNIRNLYVAEKTISGVTFLARAVGTISGTTGTSAAVAVNLACNLPEAGEYWIGSSSNCTLTALTVNYDENNVKVVAPSPFSLAAVDKDIFQPMDWAPGIVSDGALFGDYALLGTLGSFFSTKGDRTVAGEAFKYGSMALTLLAGDALVFTAPSNGTVSFYGEAMVEAAENVGTLKVVDSAHNEITLADPTFVSSTTANKVVGADSTVAFNVTAGVSYAMTADVKADVYRVVFSAA